MKTKTVSIYNKRVGEIIYTGSVQEHYSTADILRMIWTQKGINIDEAFLNSPEQIAEDYEFTIGG